MTIKEKKDYLNSYRKCERAQKVIEEEIEDLRVSFLPSLKLDDMPKGTEKRDLSDYVVRMDTLFAQLKEALDRKIETRREIRENIERMQDEAEKTLLILRYIGGKKWEEIATTMCYSVRRIHYIHGSALLHFDV